MKRSALCAGLLTFGLVLGASAQPASSAAASSATAGNAGAAATATNRSGAASGGSLAAGDKTFVQKAAMGGMAEVQLGNMAQQKASSDQVKQFGARMVQDHTKANDELMQIASGKGLKAPTDIDDKHKKDMDRLQKLTGAQFDKAYMSHMVADHKKDVADFKKEAGSGHDADLKAFASKTLPTLQEHLKMAQTTNDAVKKAK